MSDAERNQTRNIGEALEAAEGGQRGLPKERAGMAAPVSRLCCWCGQPATRYTFRPAEAPAYQEWCDRHAPTDARPLNPPANLGRTIPNDRPLDPDPGRDDD